MSQRMATASTVSIGGRTAAPIATGGCNLPRYERPREEATLPDSDSPGEHIPYSRAAAALAHSPLSEGSRRLLLGLLRLGCAKVFPGGGVGIEYGSLLKTAARPEYIGQHVAEAAAHLREREVDILLVPGMSGYPVGAMYALASGIPSLLLKKTKLRGDETAETYPPGSFVIPSYTGEGDVVISADLDAAQDIVDEIVATQLAAQRDAPRPALILRAAGADDIIDKATMSRAVGDCAVAVGEAAMHESIRRHRAVTGDTRPIECQVEVRAWVTPLIKGYNRPHEHLARAFNIAPFAGINVTSVHLRPAAIGVEGVGVLAFAADR